MKTRQSAVCRTCLAAEGLRPLFSSADLVDTLQLLTGLMISRGDGLPQSICKKCKNLIKSTLAFRERSKASEQTLLARYRYKEKPKMKGKRISFANKAELRSLTNIRDEDFVVVKEEDIKIKLENLSSDIEIKSDISRYMDSACSEDTVLISFNDDILAVSADTREDDLVESILSEIEKNKLKNENILEKIDLSTRHECENDKDINDIDGHNDVAHLDADSDDDYLKKCDVNTEHVRKLDEVGSTAEDCANAEEIGSMAVEDAANVEKDSVKAEGKRVYTRLDLIDGAPDKFGPNKCKLCKKTSPNLKAFYKHLNSKHFGTKKTILCEFCAMRFADNQKLLRHCRAKHGLARDNSFPCAYCTYQALDKEQLEVHERRVHTKERPFVCDNCGAGFYSKRVLIQHARNHTDDKPFQCDKCPSKFKTRQRLCGHNLKIHVRRFTYACHVCDKRLSKSPYIRRHLLREHGLPLERQGRLHKIYFDQ